MVPIPGTLPEYFAEERDPFRQPGGEPRLPAAHRGADAVSLGLVARSKHNARAHDHRTPAETRIVALLDGSKERVDVGVKDGRLSYSEHMFA